MKFNQETDKTASLLICARSFIERGWCQWAQARDANGNADVAPSDQRAVAWCPFGALVAAGMKLEGRWSEHPAHLRLEAAMDGHITHFNDRQKTVEPVLAAFDRAIYGALAS